MLASRSRRRIGINAHLLTEEETYRRAGVGRYIRSLLEQVPQEDPESDYTAFVSRRCALSLPLRRKRSRLPTHRPAVRVLWEQFLQPFELRSERIALLHSPVNVQPAWLPCRGVVTVTDLSFMAFPESFRSGQRYYQKLFVGLSARRADHLITYSTSTALDVTKHFGVPRSRISVTHPGVDAAFRPISDLSALSVLRQRRNLPDRFILFVGTLEPRKNLVMLLEAYAEFRRGMRECPQLVLAGALGWLHRPIHEAVQELDLSSEVVFAGYVQEEELPLWYNAAEVFVYPSLYEGFGLPPLEALACGTPVIVSNASSLPEVVGSAALLLDPSEPGAWAAALRRLCADADLRSELISQGLERARQFTWKRMARQTVQVYDGVLNSGKKVCDPGGN